MVAQSQDHIIIAAITAFQNSGEASFFYKLDEQIIQEKENSDMGRIDLTLKSIRSLKKGDEARDFRMEMNGHPLD